MLYVSLQIDVAVLQDSQKTMLCGALRIFAITRLKAVILEGEQKKCTNVFKSGGHILGHSALTLLTLFEYRG